MSLHDDICEAFKTQILPSELNACKVTSWSDYSFKSNGCDTCGPDIEHEVSIYYVNANNESKSWTYRGKFTELLERLT